MVELNWNQNPDRYRALDRITKNLPPVLLPIPHRCICLARRRAGRGNGPTRDSGNMGKQHTNKMEEVHIG